VPDARGLWMYRDWEYCGCDGRYKDGEEGDLSVVMSWLGRASRWIQYLIFVGVWAVGILAGCFYFWFIILTGAILERVTVRGSV